MELSDINRDWPVFIKEGDVAIGAVREVTKGQITVYIEGFGDQPITEDQIASVHDTKVVLNMKSLPDDVRTAIETAHDGEDRKPVDRLPID